MNDRWLRLSMAVLLGGLLSANIRSPVQPWLLGILLLLALRLSTWRPPDFFGRLWHKEFILLAISISVGFLYQMSGEMNLDQPLALNQVEVRGKLEDWNPAADKATGKFFIEDLSGITGKVSPAVLEEENNSGILQEENNSEDDIKAGIAGRRYQLTVYMDKEGKLPGLWANVRPGDRLTFPTRLERPKPAGTPGGFDPRLYLSVRGMSGMLTARGDAMLLAEGKPPVTWLIRQRVAGILQAWDPQETGVLQGILFGDASGIPPEITERYKITGVLHVFAASGSNVAFVLGLAWAMLGFLPGIVRTIGTVSVLFLYAGLCGGGAPIVRATILGTALLIGRLGRGRFSSLRWLSFAALGLFLANPLVLRDVGFQLSFAAAWGIMVLTPRFKLTRVILKAPRVLRIALASTLAAQVATLPILISAFHRLSLIGFITNLFILFLLGSVLEIGLCGVLLSFSSFLPLPLFQASLWLLQAANVMLAKLAGFPWADVWVLQPGWGFWLLWYAGIAVWLTGWERASFIFRVQWRRVQRLLSPLQTKIPGRILRVIALKGKIDQISGSEINFPKGTARIRLLIIPLLLLLLWSPWSGKDLEVTFLDVGQGDSLLIRTPQNHALLVDAGPLTERYDAGERLVVPYLLQTGIGRLDALLITHEHADHIGGARAVLKNIPVGWLGIPDVDERLENNEWLEGLPLQALKDTEKLRILAPGDRIALDSGAWLEVLAPREVLTGTHSDPNNNSLVLRLNYDNQTVLLTGDMEQEEMAEIDGALGNEGLDADFFKQPHHGSKYSLNPMLLDGIHPKAVFISVGKNTFGHPAPEVLAYWQARHVPVFRTDEEGTITLRLGKGRAEINTGREGRWLGQ